MDLNSAHSGLALITLVSVLVALFGEGTTAVGVSHGTDSNRKPSVRLCGPFSTNPECVRGKTKVPVISFAKPPTGSRPMYPWQRVKPGRERRPGGRSHDSSKGGSRILNERGRNTLRRHYRAARRLAKTMIAFSEKLFQALTSKMADSFVVSPLGLHMALSMTSMGARNLTLKELSKTTGLRKLKRLRKVNVHQAYHFLRNHLATVHPDVQVLEAVGLFVKPRVPLEMTFRRNVSQYYEGKFATLSDDPVRDINSWASSKTNGELSALLPRKAVKAGTEMVLASAVCVKGSWEMPFDPRKTSLGVFHSADEGLQQLPMMTQTTMLRHTERNGYRVVRISLSNNSSKKRFVLDMVLINRTAPLHEAFEVLSAKHVLQDLYRGEMKRVTLVLPKFRIRTSVPELKAVLRKMGLRKTFRRKAEFQGISSVHGLHLQKAFHKGAITLDENGIGCSQPFEKVSMTSRPAPQSAHRKSTNRKSTSWRTFGTQWPMTDRRLAARMTSQRDTDTVRPSTDRWTTRVAMDRPFVFAIREASMQPVLLMGVFTGKGDD